MSDLRNKEQEIERLRMKLHQLVTDKQGDFKDSEVTALSSHLDELIVGYEKEKSLQVRGNRR